MVALTPVGSRTKLVSELLGPVGVGVGGLAGQHRGEVWSGRGEDDTSCRGALVEKDDLWLAIRWTALTGACLELSRPSLDLDAST